MQTALEREKELSERMNEESHFKRLLEKMEREGLDFSSSQITPTTPEKSYVDPVCKTISAVLSDDAANVTLIV